MILTTLPVWAAATRRSENLQRLFVPDARERIEARTVCLPIRTLENERDIEPLGDIGDVLGYMQSHLFPFNHARAGEEEEVLLVS